MRAEITKIFFRVNSLRIKEISVRRLRSFGDYSNIAVELRADLSVADDVEKVFEELLNKINEMIDISKEIEEASVVKENINTTLKDLKRSTDEYRRLLLELLKIKADFEKLNDDISELFDRLNEKKSIIERIKEKMGLVKDDR